MSTVQFLPIIFINVHPGREVRALVISFFEQPLIFIFAVPEMISYFHMKVINILCVYSLELEIFFVIHGFLVFFNPLASRSTYTSVLIYRLAMKLK